MAVTEKVINEMINKNVSKMANRVVDFFKDQIQKGKVDYNVAFTNYLERAYDKYHRIKTLIYKTEPKELYSFFVCNTLFLDKQEIDARDINNVLDISKFVIVEGTGGIGKSTMMKHFFINALEKTDLIPVFVELKDINSFNGSVFDLVFNSVQRLGFNLEEKYFEYALKTGCFVLIIDGYDEVSAEKSNDVFRELDELCDKYCDNYFIISSRPSQSFIQFQRFTVMRVSTLSKEQALELIQKLEFDAEIKMRFLKALDEGLYDRHTSFASNPLLLTIMLLTYDNYAEIPEKLHIFYANAFETLYSKHDATKAGFKREMRCNLPYDMFKMIFAEFCFRTYLKNKYSFSYEEMRVELQLVMERTGNFDVDAYIWDLCNSICVICKDGQLYRYTHRSFQEYFTAYYLKECSDEQQQKICLKLLLIGNRAFHDDVFEMLQDMAPERFEKNVVFAILEKKEKELKKEEDRYVEYFKWMVDRVIIRMTKEDNGRLEVDSLLGIKDGEQRCLLQASRRYGKYDEADSVEKAEIEKEILKLIPGDETELRLSQKEIIDNELYFNYIKEDTWIGAMVSKVSEMYETLLNKQKQRALDLDDLLNI